MGWQVKAAPGPMLVVGEIGSVFGSESPRRRTSKERFGILLKGRSHLIGIFQGMPGMNEMFGMVMNVWKFDWV